MKWYSQSVLLLTASALAAGALGTATAFADSSGSTSPPSAAPHPRHTAHAAASGASDPHAVRRELAADVAKLLGIDASTLKADLQSGETLAQIAQSKGVPESSLIAGLEAAVKQRLDSAVQAGRLSAQQEQLWLQRLDTHLQEWVERAIPAQRSDSSPRMGHKGWLLQSAATILGVDEQTLLQDIRNGQTIAQVAQSKGVSPDALVSQILSQWKSKLDTAVRDGKLSANREQQILARLPQQLTRSLTQAATPGDIRHPFGHRPRGGWNHTAPSNVGSATDTTSSSSVNTLSGNSATS